MYTMAGVVSKVWLLQGACMLRPKLGLSLACNVCTYSRPEQCHNPSSMQAPRSTDTCMIIYALREHWGCRNNVWLDVCTEPRKTKEYRNGCKEDAPCPICLYFGSILILA